MTDVGMNLASVNYWTDQEPFLDRFKTAGSWSASGGTANSSTPVQLDADGYPTGVPAGATQVAALIGVDAKDSGKSNIYELSYSGTGKVSAAAGATVISSTAGKLLVKATESQFWVVIKDDSATNPVHDIHVVRQDQVDLFNKGEIFNPDFIAKASNWDTLRYMDWGKTNENPLVSWNDRTTPQDASWAANTGVPIEVEVALANKTHTDMWLNIPTKADDEYVRKTLEYVRDHLDIGLNVKVEYSNEVWNYSFSQAKYAQSQADALWAHDINGNGAIDAAESVRGGNEVYYGYRSAQIASIAHQVFEGDANHKLSDVLAGQAVNPALAAVYQAQGVALSGAGSIADLFSEYAITTYFGFQFGSANAADQAKIIGWAKSGSAGLDAAFKELVHGGSLSADFSLDAVMKYYVASALFAHANGLDMTAYEGGADLEYRSFAADQQPLIKAFFAQMMNDPRMGDAYTHMLNDFGKAGGIEAAVLSDVGYSAPSGYWGILDSIYQAGSARYDALVSYVAAHNLAHPADSQALATMFGTSASDYLTGGDGNDNIIGSSGSVDSEGRYTESDYYAGAGGADTIVGGLGNDHIFGNQASTGAGAIDGADSLSGGAGNDYMQGNAGADTVSGGDGNDRLYGGADADLVSGDAGNDYVQGNKGEDTVSGGIGNDVVRGGADNDSVSGNDGADTLFGDGGDDTLNGGGGHDVLTGGEGRDTFIFHFSDAAIEKGDGQAVTGDEIADFTHGSDQISLGFAVSLLNASAGSSFASVEIAATAAQNLLDAHHGAGEVAAVAVGNDTFLFFSGLGSDGAQIDSMIKLDHVPVTGLTVSDFV